MREKVSDFAEDAKNAAQVRRAAVEAMTRGLGWRTGVSRHELHGCFAGAGCIARPMLST